MFLTDTAKNFALDMLFPTGTGSDRCYLSAHTDYSASGSNRHGSKTAGEWAAASGGVKDLTASPSGDVEITITYSGSDIAVKWIGCWGGTDGDTFRGMMPNGSTGAKTFQVDDTNNKIVCEGHGWSADQKVVFYGAAPPTGITAGTTYYIGTVTTGDPDAFSLSTTPANANPVTFSGQPAAGCFVSNITEETYSSSGTHKVTGYVIAM